MRALNAVRYWSMGFPSCLRNFNLWRAFVASWMGSRFFSNFSFQIAHVSLSSLPASLFFFFSSGGHYNHVSQPLHFIKSPISASSAEYPLPKSQHNSIIFRPFPRWQTVSPRSDQISREPTSVPSLSTLILPDLHQTTWFHLHHAPVSLKEYTADYYIFT